MTDKKKKQESLDPSTVKIWLATVILVGVIIGGAAFLSAKKNTQIEPITPHVAAPVVTEFVKQETPKAEKRTANKTEAVQSSPSPVAAPQEPPVPAFSDLKISGTAGKMVLTSPVVPKDGMLPFAHTCRRSNTSPPLAWSNVPSGTKSFVLAMDMVENDKAVPKSYWTVYDIDDDMKGLPAGVQDGITHGQNDLGSVGYVGPCGRNTKQLFILRLFALDTKIELPSGAPRKDVINAMQGHILDTAELKFLQAM